MKPINELTEEELRIEIAVWCGYRNIRYDWINGSDSIKDFLHDGGRGIPSYTACHNAIASARERLTEEQREQFTKAIYRATDGLLHWNDYIEWNTVFALINASPLIQSRALVAVIREGRG